MKWNDRLALEAAAAAIAETKGLEWPFRRLSKTNSGGLLTLKRDSQISIDSSSWIMLRLN